MPKSMNRERRTAKNFTALNKDYRAHVDQILVRTKQRKERQYKIFSQTFTSGHKPYQWSID